MTGDTAVPLLTAYLDIPGGGRPPQRSVCRSIENSPLSQKFSGGGPPQALPLIDVTEINN
jgi:hypothetical protein